MENYHLPADLQQLERDLAARPRPDPTAELRHRVIQGVRAELQGNGSGNRWTFAAAVAAAVVVWINLSLSATQATDYRLRPGVQRPPVDATADEIQRLLPELSRRQARQQAVFLHTGSHLAGYPNLSGRAGPQQHLDTLGELFPQGE